MNTMKTKSNNIILRLAYYVVIALFIFFVLSACSFLDSGRFFTPEILYRSLLLWMLSIILTFVIRKESRVNLFSFKRGFWVFAAFFMSLCIYSAFSQFQFFSIYVIVIASALMTLCVVLSVFLRAKMTGEE